MSYDPQATLLSLFVPLCSFCEFLLLVPLLPLEENPSSPVQSIFGDA